MKKIANVNKNYCIISVDSGSKGAISLCTLINGEHKILKCVPFDFLASKKDELILISEIFAAAFKQALKLKLEVVSIIERPFPSPINSRLAISNQFASFGGTLLALQQNDANKTIEIHPRTWIYNVCTKYEQGLKKDGRILACKRIFGDKVTDYLLVKRKRSTILHDGIADSLLINVYFANKLLA